MGEQVLVVDRDVLFADGGAGFEGFVAVGEGELRCERWVERIDRGARFVPREGAESDPRRKQIIPYAVVSAPAGDGEDLLFLLRRTRAGTETRLHERLSVGVGGHINPVDAGNGTAAPWSLVKNALDRELAEELVLEAAVSRVELLGFVNDDTNAVGRVHFGAVFGVRLDRPAARVRETDRLVGEFVTRSELSVRSEGLETWSRYVVEALLEGSSEGCFGGRPKSDVRSSQNL